MSFLHIIKEFVSFNNHILKKWFYLYFSFFFLEIAMVNGIVLNWNKCWQKPGFFLEQL